MKSDAGQGRQVITARGVPLTEWSPRIATLPKRSADLAVDVAAGSTVLVFAAHPDDETLGVGGLISHLTGRGVSVVVACLTDGEAAFDGVGFPVPDLGSVRRAEFERAMTQLGAKALTTERLPDGQLSTRSAHLDAVVEEAIHASQAVLVLCPWELDPHPDHAALGSSVRRILANTKLPPPRMYPIWMTHGYEPTDPRVDLDRLVCLQSADEDRWAKLVALKEYVSQVRPIDSSLEPVLPQHVLERFTELPEMLIDVVEQPLPPATEVTSIAAYFDRKMAEGKDHWNDDASWYERRKRAVVLATLPRERYRSVWEPACGAGQLTQQLALRCDRLYASDGSAKAVMAARKQCAGLSQVQVDRVMLPSGPPRPDIDLVVLSEFLYYLHAAERRTMLQQTLDGCAEIADIVIAHWRHGAEDTHDSGDAVVEEAEDFFTGNGFHTTALHDDAEFLVLVLHRG